MYFIIIKMMLKNVRFLLSQSEMGLDQSNPSFSSRTVTLHHDKIVKLSLVCLHTYPISLFKLIWNQGLMAILFSNKIIIRRQQTRSLSER